MKSRAIIIAAVVGVGTGSILSAGCNYRTDRLPERERVMGEWPSAVAAQPVEVVRMTDDMRFEPASIRIGVGDTVEWRNTSQMPHTVTLDRDLADDRGHVAMPVGARPFDSGRLEPGASFRHRFDVPGRYRYICLPHEGQGMFGEVVVVGP